MELTEKIREICSIEIKIPYIAYAKDYFQNRRVEKIRDSILISVIRQKEQRFDKIINELYS